ncbi:MAG TPA: adenylate kinase [Candidatus Angelobacter sp.]|nr:adenylate kinase [Candidatus Angelobacter sp.]
MQRINVVGTSCSGKTTLARSLAARLGLPHVELDALFWGPDWTPVEPFTFRQRVERAASGDAWVIDGGYSPVRSITWRRAETVVWLDYPMPLVLGRWMRRTVRRIRSGEEFWPGSGNRESVRNALRRDGLLWWILRTHRSRRRRLAETLAARPDLQVVRLRSPREAERWLAGIQRSDSAATTAGARASAQNP